MISDNNNNHHYHFNGKSGDECDIEIITQLLPYTLDLNKDINDQDDYEANLYNYITHYADYHESDDEDVFNDDSSIYNDDVSDDCTTVASSEPLLADFFEERRLFIQSIRYLTVMEPLFALHPTEGITYDYEIDLDRFADINNRFNALYHFRNELLEIYDFDSPLFDLPSLNSQNLRNLNHDHNIDNINDLNNSNDDDLSVETKSETDSETEDGNENENGNEPAFDLEAEFRNELATRLDYDDEDDYDNNIDYEIEQLDIDALNIGVYFPDLDLNNLSEMSNTPNDSYQRTLFSTFENYWSQNNPSTNNQSYNIIDNNIENTFDNNTENSTDNNTDDTTDAIAGEIGEDDISVISLSSFYDRILSTK
ncbi:hypothetical protein DAPK24_049900 [Pichia kluyveri]|uniref:Uncharacterized protein n=1 Tax=Pichia kluyveri TaxID=36015 RepID=A0AAV5RB52_PICKL|nr:hypothetical protein DAPK24_049900 [Pichia kluyveri]